MKHIPPRKRDKHKGRKSSHPFLMLPLYLLASPEFAALSPQAVKLLLEIARQYNGQNNGDLSATINTLEARGWTKTTLLRAKAELVQSQFVVKTRQGGRHCCDLFALTWQPIDDCGGKHQHPAEFKASNLWRQKNDSLVRLRTTTAAIGPPADQKIAA